MKWRGGRSRVSRDRHKHLLCHIQARVNVGSFVAASSRGRPVQSEWRLRAVDSMGQGLTKQGPRRMGNPFIPPAVSQGQTELRTSDRDYSQSPSSGVIDAAAGSTGGIPGLGGASGSVARCTRPPTFGGSAHPTSVPRQARQVRSWSAVAPSDPLHTRLGRKFGQGHSREGEGNGRIGLWRRAGQSPGRHRSATSAYRCSVRLRWRAPRRAGQCGLTGR